ncbi:MAG TPA: hypothetical protein VD833_14380 [Vicinamibacterales bacterium]|nr:hypothetical protein [Vicinamibacterales bacterium]
MAVTLTLFRSSLVRGLDPAALLGKLNQHRCADNDACLFVDITLVALRDCGAADGREDA